MELLCGACHPGSGSFQSTLNFAVNDAKDQFQRAVYQCRRRLRTGQSIVDTVREPVIVLDKALRVIAASRSFYEIRGKPEETQGKLCKHVPLHLAKRSFHRIGPSHRQVSGNLRTHLLYQV